MTTENENIKDKELNEAELSDVKNSIASLCKKYLTGSFFDKLVDTSGIKIAKDILLSDLKNMIGRGTSGPAAKKFANAIQMAKNPVAVDTIMSNYMLKGDGMGSAIGYTESAEIKGFREYLSESKKGGSCGGKKKPSEEEIEEAIKVVEAEGYRVRLEETKEEKSFITEEEIEKAKKIVESRGFRVIDESLNDFRKVTFKTTYAEPVWNDDDDDANYKSVPIEMTVFARLNSNGDVEVDIERYRLREDGSDSERLDGRFIDTEDKDDILEMLRNGEYDDEIREALLANESKTYKGFKVLKESEEKHTLLKIQADKLGFDILEVIDLVKMALADRSVPTYLRNSVELASTDYSDGTVKIKVYDAEDIEEAKVTFIKLIDSFLENATGIEAEFSEDLLDNYSRLIELS